jgi:pyrimidine-nucleoside phosphorylase
MRLVDLIARKRDGRALSKPEIDLVIAGVSDGSIPDYQVSALLMAIVWRGMTTQETGWLTEAMVRSGERVDLSDVPGPKVGKHSTGGVGDKVSIVLAPLAAACGVVVPKMSGRGLGHTGGTLDKLESIPGFRVSLTIDEFKRGLREVGACIIGQTAALAPADKKLYALRDVTATVESIPLIAASIMSKKLAEGSPALVLDVKCGEGAFMKDLPRARTLAAAMVAIGTHAGVRTQAVVTDMEAPLGRAVGNALEIAECIQVLRNEGPEEVAEVAIDIASRMTQLAGLDRDAASATARVRQALTSGRALGVLERMIAFQGGDPRVIGEPARMGVAPDRLVIPARRAGIVQSIGAEAVGRASSVLGAGRDAVGDAVDHAVGVIVQVRPGDRVAAGEPLFELHHRAGRGVEAAEALCIAAVTIGDEALAPRRAVLDEVF